MVCAGSAGIRNCQMRRNLANRLQRFTRQCTAAWPSKCSAFGGRKAVRMPPCFQVPLRHICCILLTHTAGVCVWGVFVCVFVCVCGWMGVCVYAFVCRGEAIMLKNPPIILFCTANKIDQLLFQNI